MIIKEDDNTISFTIKANSNKEYDVTYISFKSKFEHKYQYEFKEPVFEGVHVYYAEKEKEKGDNNEDWSLRRKF